jgi:hypothetical protein
LKSDAPVRRADRPRDGAFDQFQYSLETGKTAMEKVYGSRSSLSGAASAGGRAFSEAMVGIPAGALAPRQSRGSPHRRRRRHREHARAHPHAYLSRAGSRSIDRMSSDTGAAGHGGTAGSASSTGASSKPFPPHAYILSHIID